MNTIHTPGNTPAPLFTPFEWVTRAYQNGPYDLIANVHDLAGGACAIMEMIEQSDTDAGNGDAPLFNGYNRGRLLRMAIAAMHTIELQTSCHLEKMQEDGEEKAQRAAGSGGAR